MINKRMINSEKNTELGDFQEEVVDEKINSEIPENESAVGKEEDEAQREENMKALEGLYDLRNSEAEKVIDMSEKEIADSEKGVREISKRLKGISNVSYSDRRVMSLEQKRIEGQISDLEYKALKIPEDLENGVPKIVKLKKEISEDIKKIKIEAKELMDEFMSAKEIFVKDFIEKSAIDIDKHFGSAFSRAINGKNARDVIKYKTKKEIELAAKEFIKTGKDANFGFEAVLEITSYDKVERGVKVNKEFITEYAIIVGGYEKKIRKNDNLRGSNFVPTSQSEEIDKQRNRTQKEKLR